MRGQAVPSTPGCSGAPTRRLIAWLVLLGIAPAVLDAIDWPRYHLTAALVGESVVSVLVAAAVAQAVLLAFGRYVLLGILLGPISRRSITAALFCAGVGLAAVVVFESTDSLLASQRPSFAAYALGGIGLLLGLAIATPWGAGPRGRRWAWVLIAVSMLVPAVLGFTTLIAATTQTPPQIIMPQVTSHEKRRLTALVRDHRRVDPNSPNLSTIAFTWHDLRLLAAWGCQVVAPRAIGVIEREDQAVHIIAVLPIATHRYICVEATLAIEADDRGLRLEWHELRLGKHSVPASLASLATPIAIRLARQDALGSAVLSAMRELKTDAAGLTLTYDRIAMPDESLAHVTGTLSNPAMIESIRFYIDRVLDAGSDWPDNDSRFVRIVAAVFDAARTRSIDSDPIDENKAAVLAIAATLGHSEIARFIGPIFGDRQLARLSVMKRPRLQARTDWPRHFALSAGLAVLSTEGVSDAVGLLKEVLDAGAGGSGFSFTDLAADRAGTRFGLVATRSPQDAARIQKMLAHGFDPYSLLPAIADLPEGLPDSEFRRRFGEVGSDRYQRVMRDIEERLDALPALN